MDTNGIPSIVIAPSTGELAQKAAQDAILGLSGPSQVSVATVAGALIAEQTGPAMICLNTLQRRFVSAPSSQWDTIESGCDSIVNRKFVQLEPVAGQTGRSLEWERGGATSGFHAATLAAIDSVLAPVTPKYTAWGIMQALAAALPDGADAYIAVNQATGTLTVWQSGDGTIPPDAPNTGTLAANGGIIVELSEPTSGGVVPKKFEGGAF